MSATPSFKPVLIAKKTPTDDKEQARGDVYSSLYTRAVQQQQRRREAVAARADAECTFTPKTRSAGKRGRKGARRRLYDAEQMKAKAVEREALREKHETENCTFVPAINRSGRSGDSAGSVDQATAAKRAAVYDKLFEDAKKSQAKLQAVAKAREAEERATLTFKPAINRSRSKSPSRQRSGPVGERLYRSGVESAARRQAITASATAGMEGCTFKPQISKASAQRAAAKAKATEGSPVPVHERLFKEAKNRPKRVDSGEPRIVWEALLRPEGEEPATVKPVQLTAEQQATFERLYKQAEVRTARTGAVDEKPDWELLLRQEQERAAEEGRPVQPMNAEAAAKQAAVFERLFSAAKQRAAAGGAGADSGAVSFATTLRKSETVTPSKPKKLAAASVASGERLSKATLKKSKVADLDAAEADAQATMLRTCWHATLRTERPVATAAFNMVEAV